MQSITFEQTILITSMTQNLETPIFIGQSLYPFFFNLVLLGYLDNFSFLFVPQISLYNHCHLIFNVLITKHFYGAASFFTYHTLFC